MTEGGPSANLHETCWNCRHAEDFTDTEPEDEVNMYCVHPIHLDKTWAYYSGYHGHWTHTTWRCEGWERK